MSGGEEYLEDLAGYEYVSQLRVTPYNFIPNHRTFMFTVSAISEDLLFGTQAGVG